MYNEILYARSIKKNKNEVNICKWIIDEKIINNIHFAWNSSHSACLKKNWRLNLRQTCQEGDIVYRFERTVWQKVN